MITSRSCRRSLVRPRHAICIASGWAYALGSSSEVQDFRLAGGQWALPETPRRTKHEHLSITTTNGQGTVAARAIEQRGQLLTCFGVCEFF